ncbi:hypothetical protein PDIG_53200 [Penicillium digitatum PHI26]|uniref:Uncharacterized protein n=1 Tax=Penicillium digitatum (strain PHI26 / CECT 20796) TaxID=1170229 RepID=K9FR37_PEND2|nr:hypothetical protein PDIG_53200 [Penicillium digitatum PHI26]
MESTITVTTTKKKRHVATDTPTRIMPARKAKIEIKVTDGTDVISVSTAEKETPKDIGRLSKGKQTPNRKRTG